MPTPPAPLVGRALLLARIGAAVREGRGIALTGPSGSGGSRMIMEAFVASRRAGLRVARLAPETGHAATLALDLDALFLDDAHRLDEATSALVEDLARGGAAVVANASGHRPLPDALRRLIAEGRVDEVPLEPLTHDEVIDLAEGLLGDPIEPGLAIALSAVSGDRPGTLTEVVDDAVGSGAIAHADGIWRLLAPLPAPRAVRAAVVEAFGALSPEQRGWIAAVAQAGLLADDHARRIAAAQTVDAAHRGGWTVRDPGLAATRIATAPISAAVLGSLDLRARVAVLRRLIAVTEASERPLDDTERIAVVRWRVEVGMPVDPAEVWRLAMLPAADPATREVLLRAAVQGGAPAGADLADLLRRTRRPAQALELIDKAMPEVADATAKVSLLRVRTMTTGIIERNSGDALRELETHLTEAGEHPDLAAVRAGMLLMEGRPDDALTVAEGAVAAAADEPGFATAFGLTQAALAHRELGHLEAAAETGARLLGLEGEREGFPDGAALARWLPFELAVAVGADPDAVEERLSAAREAVAPELRTAQRPALSYTLAGVHLLRADPGTAVRLLRDAEAGGGAWREGWLPRIVAELVIAQALSGALEDAAATRERLVRLTCPPVHRGRVDLATAQLLHLRGASDAARSIARAVADRGRDAGLALDAFDGLLAALRYGDEQAAQQLLDLGPFPSGRGRDLERGYAAALLTRDAAAVDRASVDLWTGGLRLYAIEAAERAAGLGSPDATSRLVAWRARLGSLRLPTAGIRRTGWLTAREREVALLAADGASDRAIAEELDITLRTAQTHLGRALAKLGIHRRTELRGLVLEP